jgi:NADPH:quinone reductase-like Zn-dependent oxidoreductase
MLRQEVQRARSSRYNIDFLPLNRWSPASMSSEELIDRNLMSLLGAARRAIIKPVVSNRFNLNQATEALQMLKEGKIVGRGVINP